ncbi:MAG TPA: YggS family pyridoxal phosphate-dependent enzyme [Verrucomicrobiales bacterium]|nr:YggS family pyridoxal phosphate-dependent enzyme [Verrucomicrobiales bacterium]
MPSAVAENLARVRSEIAAAAHRSGRVERDVELLAVAKGCKPEKILEAEDAGQSLFGENRVQEALQKIPLLPGRLTWDLIGHLQTNKIRKALSLFRQLHSVDSLDLARQIDRIAALEGVFPEIYLQVNIAGEIGKFGFDPDELRREFEEILALKRLHLIGLMNIPPLASHPEDSRVHFARLREFRDSLAQESGVPLPGLSMGMSDDYALAIEEGATVVRVGAAIFGPRSQTRVR